MPFIIMNIQSPEAIASVERLFNEPFETAEERRKRKSIEDAIIVDVEFKWARTAYRTVEHISENHPPKKPLPTFSYRKYGLMDLFNEKMRKKGIKTT